MRGERAWPHARGLSSAKASTVSPQACALLAALVALRAARARAARRATTPTGDSRARRADPDNDSGQPGRHRIRALRVDQRRRPDRRADRHLHDRRRPGDARTRGPGGDAARRQRRDGRARRRVRRGARRSSRRCSACSATAGSARGRRRGHRRRRRRATSWSCRSWRRPATPPRARPGSRCGCSTTGGARDIDLADPPRPPRGITGLEQLPPSGGTARFEIVSTTESSAIVGSAHDGHGVRIAVGCVDLLGSSLVAGGSRRGRRCRCTTPSPVRSGASP